MDIPGRTKDLGDGFVIRRVLPHARCRSVGPWVFLDHFGPLEATPGQLVVRPHPHIGLATVTYLYDGAIVHRDSLGSHQTIRPGAVNLMTAGRGIVHSERSEDYAGPFHGLQLWLALPTADEEMDPSFHHEPAERIPSWQAGPTTVRLLIGTWQGRTSGVPVRSPTLFADVTFASGGTIRLRREHDELAILPAVSDVSVNGVPLSCGTIRTIDVGEDAVVEAEAGARLVVIGGTSLGERKMFWNFVHSRSERIEVAKQRWRDGRFPEVPGDDDERIPLPG
jgi:hypothetical protein